MKTKKFKIENSLSNMSVALIENKFLNIPRKNISSFDLTKITSITHLIKNDTRLKLLNIIFPQKF